MCCAMNVVELGKLECLYMIVDREACLIGSNIKTYNMSSFVFSYKFHRFHTLIIRKMPERTENDSRINAVCFYSFLCRLIYGPDHFIGSKALHDMLKGSKSHLGVYDIIGFKLPEKIKCNEVELFFSLHQLKTLYRSCYVIGQVGA